MRGGVVLGVIVSIFAGCASTNTAPFDAKARRQLSEGPVHAVSYPSPTLYVFTPGRAVMAGVLGPIGGLVVASQSREEGKTLRDRPGTIDPASLALDALAARLVAHSIVRGVQRASVTPDGDDVADLRQAGLRSVVLDVKTSKWWLTYYPTNWNRFRVVYAARARFVDVDADRILWEAGCEGKAPDEPAASPTLQEFRQPDGRVLREKLGEAITACVEQMLARLPRD
jgi:hypothetical protein